MGEGRSLRDLRSALRAALRPALLAALVLFGAAVLFWNVLPTRAEGAATEQRVRELEARNGALRERIGQLEREADQLETDALLTERIVRDEYGMSRDDELIVR